MLTQILAQDPRGASQNHVGPGWRGGRHPWLCPYPCEWERLGLWRGQGFWEAPAAEVSQPLQGAEQACRTFSPRNPDPGVPGAEGGSVSPDQVLAIGQAQQHSPTRRPRSRGQHTGPGTGRRVLKN